MSHRDELSGAVQRWSIAEQLLFVQDVWDGIADSAQAFAPSEEVGRELDRRVTAADAAPQDVLDRQTIERRVRRKP